jgi:16S rRNA (guanine1516-N2)-methyltransferase
LSDLDPSQAAKPQLQRIDGRLYLVGEAGKVSVDLVEGTMGFRRRQGGGRGQAVARAVGLKRAKVAPRVVDATAGLGRDAFILATLGCPVLALERHVDVFALFQDGLRRAFLDEETADALGDRLQLQNADALSLLREWPGGVLANFLPDVIYLDPMHPPRRKSALPRKEMRLFRELVGEDHDQVELAEAALATGVARVVVKRPAGEEPLLPEVVSAVAGKTTRFDIYLPTP